MNLWAVAMVKDELDVLPYTLDHLVNEGVAGIIIADNLSTDGTWEWLEAANYPCHFEVVRDPEVGFYQSRKISALTQAAASYGADWVLPFDADELWFNPIETRPLVDTLAAVSRGDVVRAELFNHFPTSEDNDDPNPYLRITRRDPRPAPLPKVIVRPYSDLMIDQGNHGASTSFDLTVAVAPVAVGHVPWRSPEQFLRKVANGSRAYDETTLDEDVGAHWRHYGAILHHHGPAAIKDLYNQWFHDPAMPLETAPAPWRRDYKTSPSRSL